MKRSRALQDKTYHGIKVPWRYLIAAHGEATLRDWAARLQHFRFCRAVPGGHAADGDSLCLALNDGPLPRRLTRDFPEIDSAGRHLVADIPVHFDFGDGVLRLTLCGAAGDIYAVTQADVENALAIEKKIKPLAAHIIDPPLDSAYCIAPEFWPEFWREE